MQSREEVHDVFISRLKFVMDDQGFTIGELARKAKINHASVRAWFAQKSLPRADAIVKICDVLYISSDYLLGLSDEM